MNSKRTADEQQVNTTNNINNKKNKEPSSSGDEADVIITKKKKRLEGKRLGTFLLFWDAFDYKTGRAEAADAWLEIPTLTEKIVSDILSAAKKEAERRSKIKADGKTPKMAQGWISGRRWEDEDQEAEAWRII